MRVFNVRLAAILFAIVVVFGVGVFFLHGFQVKKNATFFLNEARKSQEVAAKAAKDGNIELDMKESKRAIDYFGWYVTLMPKDIDAAEEYANLLADKACQGDAIVSMQLFNGALNRLEELVRLSPNRSDARRRLVKMYLQKGRFKDAKQHLEQYLLPNSPNDPELLEQLGQCQAATGESKLAVDSFKKAISLKKTQLTSYAQLASLLRYRFQRPDEADALMEKLVRSNPKSHKAYLLRAIYLIDPKVGQSERAIDDIEEALKLAPDDAAVLLFAARCKLFKKQYNEARDCLARGIGLFPGNAEMHGLMAEVELRTGNRDKAIAAYERGIKATKRDPKLLFDMGNLLVDANRLAETKKIAEELRTTNASRSYPEFLTARVDLAEQHWLAARQRFEAVRGDFLSQPGRARMIDFWLSECYRQLGDPDRQEQALRNSLKIDPSFGPAREALSALRIQTGRGGDSGRLEIDDLAPSGSVQLARTLLFKTKQQKASQRNWQAVEKAIDAAEKAQPGSPTVTSLRVEMLVAQERYTDAEALVLAARDKDQKQPWPWSALIMLAERQEDTKKARRLLDESRQALGDSVEQRLIQSQYLVRHRDKDTNELLRKLAKNTDQFPERARLALWSGLFGAAIQVGDTEQADLLAKKIAEKQPTNAIIRIAILERAIASRDEGAIQKALDDVKLVAGESLHWLYGKAVLLLLQAEKSQNPAATLQSAFDYLTRARELRKDWAKIPTIEGSIHDRLGNTEAALRSYREAIDLGERNPAVLQRIVVILYQSRQVAEAVQLLRRLEDEHVSLPPLLLRILVENALQNGEFARAIKIARNAVTTDSKDFNDQLWLGQVLTVTGLQAKSQGNNREATDLLTDAERALRKAVEIQPKSPDARVVLVRLLHHAGDDAKAEAAIQDASKTLAAQDVPFARALCYEIMAKPKEAQKEFEAALAAAPQNIAVIRAAVEFYSRTGKFKPAEALLQQVLDHKVDVKEADMIWARRQFAIMLIKRHDYKSFKKAQALVEQNLAGAEASPNDRSILAKLKAADPDRSERQKAVEILKSLIASRSATPEDVLELAKILMDSGNWPEASELLRDLVAGNSKESHYLAVYIEALLQHNEVSTVEMYLERLMSLAPNWFATASLQADLLCSTNEPLQAFNVLKSFVDKTDSIPTGRAARLRVVAEKLDQLGRQLTNPDQAAMAAKFATQAESLYRTFLKENPGQDLVLAVFLGTRDKVDEALDILEKALPTSSLEDFAQASSLIVDGGKVNRKQLDRLDTVIQMGMKKFERPVDLLLVQAAVRTRQEKFGEAVGIYRKALEKAPDNIVALNNLAVLLALQGINSDEALKCVNQAIDVAGPGGAMLDSRATVYMAMDNAEKALEDIQAAVADRPTPVRLFHLAQAYSLAGDAKNARAAFDKAKKKGLTKELLQPLEFSTFDKLRLLQR
jgi:cellulose synthase operon protein C